MGDILKREIAWQCMNCGAKLTNEVNNLVCRECGIEYKSENGWIDFLKLNQVTKSQHSDVFRDFFKRWPGFYYFVAHFFGPMWFCGVSSKSFLDRFSSSGLKINIGSGPRRLAENVVNIDIFPFKGVDVIANAEKLPFQEESVDRIICDNVLEHVKYPTHVINEMKRVLTPGGLAYISTPFLYPFHNSPSDYSRWTETGLINLCADFETVAAGTRAGIFSTLTVYLCYLLATLLSFGSTTLYGALVNISMFIFWPIKLLDLIFFWVPASKNTAAVLYIIIKKRV